MNAVESATTEPDRDRQVDALIAQVKALPEIGVAPVEAFDPLAEAQLYQAIRT